jgi:hypothetical protein
VCAGQSLLPRSLQIELEENLTGAPSSHGAFGEVWKHDYRGQQVAVKVLKVYKDSDLRKVTRVSPQLLPPSMPIGVLTVNHVEILQGVHHVEISPSSERVAIGGGDNVWGPAHDGL